MTMAFKRPTRRAGDMKIKILLKKGILPLSILITFPRICSEVTGSSKPMDEFPRVW